MQSLLKRSLLGTPLERLARRLYIRLDPSSAGHYDRQTLLVMQRWLRPDSNCVDVGAHRGAILAEILRLAPRGQHYAFEPVPQHCAYLARSFPGVHASQLALSDSVRQATFYHDRRRPTRSSLGPPSNADAAVEQLTVRTDRLDNIIPPSLPIRFVKIDVEGAEYQVLAGGINTLAANRPLVIFEYTPLPRNPLGVPPAALFDLLVSECRLSISLMSRWLENRLPLSREEFLSEAGREATVYLIAHP